MPSMLVLVEGARSAEPPMNHGTAGAMALITLPEAAREAMPFSSAGNTGSTFSQPLGHGAIEDVADLGLACSLFASLKLAKVFFQAAFSSAPRCPMPASKCSRTPSGTRNFASSGQP